MREQTKLKFCSPFLNSQGQEKQIPYSTNIKKKKKKRSKTPSF